MAGVAVIAGLVYLPVWLHRNEPPPDMTKPPPEKVVLADVPDATLVGRHEGHKLWQIHARHIQAAADGNTTTFIGVDRGTLYRNDAPAARVAAGRAVYQAARRTLDVTEGLRFEAGGFTLRAPRLHWSAASDAVVVPETVTLSWQGGVATAASLRADTRLREITGRNVRMAARLEGPMFEKLTKKLAAGAALGLLLATASAGGAAAPPGYREVKVSGDVWRYNQATRIHTYDGHIVAVQGDTTMRADHIAYNEKENTAVVTGHITVDNPRNHAEGDTAAVDFDLKTIRLRGVNGVKLVALPAKPGENDDSLRGRVKEPVTLTCPEISYNYKTKRADLPGPVKVVRKGQVLTGDTGVYVGAEELVTLTGNVHGTDEKNQTFSAPSVKASLAKDAEWLEAPSVKATFFVKDDDTGAPPDKPAAASPAVPASP
jgi:lipopolysaccharide export system protein LptA